jgi:uncharacterized protein (DUF58 family)
MNNTTEGLIERIRERVFRVPIKVLWRSRDLMPRNGQRRSLCRGSAGYAIISRNVYEPGDDPRSIDHFATAQTGDDTIITIKFQEPTDMSVVLVVDVGRTMQFGTTRVTKSVLSAELAASILTCADKTKDRAKVVTVSQANLETTIRLRGAKSAFIPAMEAILEPPESAFAVVAPEPEPAGGKLPLRLKLKKALLPAVSPDAASKAAGAGVFRESGLAKALSTALPRRKSLVFVISDFLSMNENDREVLANTAGRHDVFCLVVQDERERELPPGRGVYHLRDMSTGEVKRFWLNERNRKLFRENAQQKLDELSEFFIDANCDWEVFSTEQSADDVITLMIRLFGGHRR